VRAVLNMPRASNRPAPAPPSHGLSGSKRGHPGCTFPRSCTPPPGRGKQKAIPRQDVGRQAIPGRRSDRPLGRLVGIRPSEIIVPIGTFTPKAFNNSAQRGGEQSALGRIGRDHSLRNNPSFEGVTKSPGVNSSPIPAEAWGVVAAGAIEPRRWGTSAKPIPDTWHRMALRNFNATK